MSIGNEVSELIRVLGTNGYQVRKGGCPKELENWYVPEEYRDYWFLFSKSKTTDRSGGKGGFLVVNESDEVSYDFFKGGSKYGKHFNSYQGMFDEGWFSSDLDLEGVRNFLGFRN